MGLEAPGGRFFNEAAHPQANSLTKQFNQVKDFCSSSVGIAEDGFRFLPKSKGIRESRTDRQRSIKVLKLNMIKTFNQLGPKGIP